MLYNSWYVKGRRCGAALCFARRRPGSGARPALSRRGKAAAVRGCPSLRACSGTCTAPGAALKAFDRKKMDCDYYYCDYY